ncbi:TPA: hypothetical protein ACNV18_000839 [Pseudomonas putida]|uniref:hypothetical protein n=1 Tax=Pseudomonas sp. MB-090624 TaxID=2213078 RepID=UPI0011B834AE|nr:hypothetical protein [Pseudomonas sp. MB-090624]
MDNTTNKTEKISIKNIVKLACLPALTLILINIYLPAIFEVISLSFRLFADLIIFPYQTVMLWFRQIKDPIPSELFNLFLLKLLEPLEITTHRLLLVFNKLSFAELYCLLLMSSAALFFVLRKIGKQEKELKTAINLLLASFAFDVTFNAIAIYIYSDSILTMTPDTSPLICNLAGFLTCFTLWNLFSALVIYNEEKTIRNDAIPNGVCVDKIYRKIKDNHIENNYEAFKEEINKDR